MEPISWQIEAVNAGQEIRLQNLRPSPLHYQVGSEPWDYADAFATAIQAAMADLSAMAMAEWDGRDPGNREYWMMPKIENDFCAVVWHASPWAPTVRLQVLVPFKGRTWRLTPARGSFTTYRRES